MNRIASIIGSVTAALILAGLSVSARAADNELGRNWTIRAGFFIPENEAPRRAQGDIWFTVGAERPFYTAERWEGTFSIDYYGAGGVYNIPITLNARGETNRLRYGIGAGVGISHDLTDGILGFSYNLLIGYTVMEGASPVVADIRYQGLSTGSRDLNGWQFTLGLRF